MAGADSSAKSNFSDKIAKLSKVHKIIILVVTLVLMIGPSIWFLFRPKYQDIDRLKKDLSKVRSELATAKKKAATLSQLKKEMEDLELEFNIAKRALPEKEEIPTLLTSISYSGQDAGLEFLLFQPNPEKKLDFYAEIPVSISVSGEYHDVALFFYKVARLSRIVNIKDIKMSNPKGKKDNQGNEINTSCVAVTYKFLEALPNKK